MSNFSELAAHTGHMIAVVTYGNPPVNAAVECETCGTVLFDYDRPENNGSESGAGFHTSQHKQGPNYKAQAARDAYRWGGARYADMIEERAMAHAAKFPDRAAYFMTRTIGEALRGNDGI